MMSVDEPQVAFPHLPENSRPVSEAQGIELIRVPSVPAPMAGSRIYVRSPDTKRKKSEP